MGSQLFHFLLIQGTIMKIYILTRGTEVFIGYWHDLAAREACIMLGRDLSPELPPVIWVHFATGDFG